MDSHRPSDAGTLDTNPNLKTHQPTPIKKKHGYLVLRLVTGIVGVCAFGIFIDFHIKREKLKSRCLSLTSNPRCYYSSLYAYQQPWWALAMTASVISMALALFDTVIHVKVYRRPAPLQATIVLLDLVVASIAAAGAGSLLSSDIWKYAGPEYLRTQYYTPQSDLSAPLAMMFVVMSFHVFIIVWGLVLCSRAGKEATHIAPVPVTQAQKERNLVSWGQVERV